MSESTNTGPTSIFEIDMLYFNKKLEEYNNYTYWVQDHFDDVITVEYDNFHADPDSVSRDITGIEYNIEDRFDISLRNYSRFMYNASLYKQSHDIGNLNKTDIMQVLKLRDFQNSLISEQKLVSGLPIKMNTLANKADKITNFDPAIDNYNVWVKGKNHLTPITQEIISARIETENKIYD